MIPNPLKSRLVQQRVFYRTPKDWLLGTLCQVAFRQRYRGPLHRRVVKLHLRASDKPFFVRMGTSDCDVLAQIFFNGEYNFLRDGALGDVKTVIDLGANVGFFSRWISDVYPAATIVGVEPDPSNMQMLRRNVEAGGLSDRYTFHQACAAATVRHVQLNRSRGEWGFSMEETTATGSPLDAIPTVTLEELTAATSGHPVDLLKCDIEGAEVEIFRDCSAWIDKVGALVIETHPPYGLDPLQSDLHRSGADFDTRAQLDVGFGLYVFLLTRAGKPVA